MRVCENKKAAPIESMELFLLYGARSALQANGTNNRLLGVNVSVSMAGCT